MVHTMGEKVDLKKTRKQFFSAKPSFEMLTLPLVNYLMIDGKGSPDSPAYAQALEKLYPLAYTIKFSLKAAKGDFVVAPLEGLWWAEDMTDYLTDTKDNWQWRMMIMMPDCVSSFDVELARDTLHRKKKVDTSGVRLESLEEGLVVQILHVGPYSEEAATLADLHHRFMPENNLVFNGLHHEIYLNDPRKTDPAKLKTILRQPVQFSSR